MTIDYSNYTESLPLDLKNTFLNHLDGDEVSGSALSLTNMQWNKIFKEKFEKSSKVTSIYAHIKKLENRHEFVDLFLKKATISSINTLIKWIIARDTIVLRRLMAEKILEIMTWIVEKNDPIFGKVRLPLMNICNDGSKFVSGLAINPLDLKSLDEFLLNSEKPKNHTSFIDYVTMINAYINDLDLSGKNLVFLSEDLNLLKNLRSIKTDETELDLSPIKTPLKK